LKLKYDKPLSSFGFNFNLRHCITEKVFRRKVNYVRDFDEYTYYEKVEYLATVFKVGYSTVKRWLKAWNLTVTTPNGLTPMPPVDQLRRLRDEHPDAKLAQLSALCGVSPHRLGRQLRRLHIVRFRVSNESVHAGVEKVRTGPFSSFGLTLTQGRAFFFTRGLNCTPLHPPLSAQLNPPRQLK
jgi:hypothetical protein